MSYTTDVDGVLTGTEYSEARSFTSHSTVDEDDQNKASRTIKQQWESQDNISTGYREGDRAAWGLEHPEECKVTQKKGEGKGMVHHWGTCNTPLERGMQGVPNQELHMP